MMWCRMMTALLCFPLVTASVVTPRASSCTYVRRHVAGTSPRRHVRDTRRTYVTRGVRSPSSAGAYANNLLAWLGGCEVVGKESADDVWACAPPPAAPHVYTYVDLYPSMPSTHAELDGCELQGGMLPSPSLAIERLQSRNSLSPVTPVCLCFLTCALFRARFIINLEQITATARKSGTAKKGRA